MMMTRTTGLLLVVVPPLISSEIQVHHRCAIVVIVTREPMWTVRSSVVAGSIETSLCCAAAQKLWRCSIVLSSLSLYTRLLALLMKRNHSWWWQMYPSNSVLKIYLNQRPIKKYMLMSNVTPLFLTVGRNGSFTPCYSTHNIRTNRIEVQSARQISCMCGSDLR